MVRCLLGVNAAAVLRTDIIALPVQRGRVMNDKENFKQLAQTHHLVVVRQSHHLVVAGVAAANVFIGGPQHMAIAIARLHIGDAAHAHVDRFQTPEAAATEGDRLKCHGQYLTEYRWGDLAQVISLRSAAPEPATPAFQSAGSALRSPACGPAMAWWSGAASSWRSRPARHGPPREPSRLERSRS